jgi:uncharacterized membrane protein YjjP (DUF1212 family)
MLMDSSELLKLALRAGEIMLSNGAETYRVEDTVKRMLDSLGLAGGEAFVTATGIFASCEDPERGIITAIKRVKMRQTEFEKIIRVNEISRRLERKEISPEKAALMLDDAGKISLFPIWLKGIASGVASAGFAFMLGGKLPDCFNALITGFILQFCLIFLYRMKIPGVLINILGGAIISLVSMSIFALGLGLTADKIIIGSLMPMLPGLSITSAIRDVVEGDFLSGTTRMTDAILTAVAIAVGVGSVLGVVQRLFSLNIV